MNIADVKPIIGVKADEYKHDEYLEAMIPLLIEKAEDLTNNDFSKEIPAGVKLFVAFACKFNMGDANLKSFKMGEVSYSYNTEFPSHITDHLKPYRKARLRRSCR